MIVKIIKVIIPIFCILLFTILFLYLVDHKFNFSQEFFSKNPSDIRHIGGIHDAALIVLTIIVACITWIQLRGIKETGQADFLLRIDERLGDTNIVKAREIIHFIYAASKKREKNGIKYTEEQHGEFIADEINKLGNDYKNKKKYGKICLSFKFFRFLGNHFSIYKQGLYCGKRN